MKISAGSVFDVEVKISNLQTGFSSHPEVTYLTFSQQLIDNGVIKRHSHVVIGKIVDNGIPPDPHRFEFFDGLVGIADGEGGVLATSVGGGLDAGLYRLCSITTSFSHQLVFMPVAARGAQDDCIRFRVV